MARWLRGARDLPSKFQNYIMEDYLLRLMQVSNLSAEFGEAAFISFLVSLLAPSETLWMRKADDSDRLTAPPPRNIR